MMEEGHIEDTDATGRIMVTGEQMEGLIEFIEQHPVLAKGKTKPLNLSQSLWTQCAEKLNNYKDGARKNGKQWAKCWTDLKYRVRRRALELQTAKTKGDPRPEELLPLSKMEERMLAVIGQEDVVVIQCDPLSWENQKETNTNEENDESFDPGRDETSPPRTKRRKRRSCKSQNSNLQDFSEDLVNSRDKKQKLDNAAHTTADSDSNDSASAFLELEKRKLENAERLTEAVLCIRDQITRISEVFIELKDFILNKSNS